METILLIGGVIVAVMIIGGTRFENSRRNADIEEKAIEKAITEKRPIKGPAKPPRPDHDFPRGIRNNNPGNIRDVGIPWVGLVGRDDVGYAIFDDSLNGIRAMAIDLKTGYKRGEDTVREIINQWAPPHENPTRNYVSFVAKKLNVEPDEHLTMNESTWFTLIESIIEFENGYQPYPASKIYRAISRANLQ